MSDESKLLLLERLLRLAEAQWKNAKNQDESEHWEKQHKQLLTKIFNLKHGPEAKD